MSAPQEYGQTGVPIDQLGVDARADFITKTYNHLMGAIVAFIGIQLLLFGSGAAEPMAVAMMSLPGGWMVILGAFILVGWLAEKTALQSESLGAQYAALAGYVVIEAVIFVPMLVFANATAPGVISSAAIVSLLGFGGLTAIVFTTRKDFSFMGGMLKWMGILALVAIGASLLFGAHLGTWFSVARVGLAGASILYDTSNVLHHCPEDRYVAASLSLFASVALLFWYVLRLFLPSDD